jgi:hypothetical protein
MKEELPDRPTNQSSLRHPNPPPKTLRKPTRSKQEQQQQHQQHQQQERGCVYDHRGLVRVDKRKEITKGIQSEMERLAETAKETTKGVTTTTTTTKARGPETA